MDKNQVREAVVAGEAALESIHKAQDKLGSARNWGIFDMIGGGMISSLVKHSRMDDASRYMEEAKRRLCAFEKELEDITISADFSIETGNFMRFADTFLDNIFIDAMVQFNINEAITKLDAASIRVRGILAKLYPLLNEYKEE